MYCDIYVSGEDNYIVFFFAISITAFQQNKNNVMMKKITDILNVVCFKNKTLWTFNLKHLSSTVNRGYIVQWWDVWFFLWQIFRNSSKQWRYFWCNALLLIFEGTDAVQWNGCNSIFQFLYNQVLRTKGTKNQKNS